MAANHGYRLSFFNWMFFALIGIFLTSPFMNLMSDTPFIVESGSSYMRIITIGSLFCIVQMTSEKILQATGNMIVPMICGIIGGVSNIILDPLFIFGIGPFPELGVAGAGVATIGGQFLSMCVGQIVLFKGKHAVKVRLWGCLLYTSRHGVFQRDIGHSCLDIMEEDRIYSVAFFTHEVFCHFYTVLPKDPGSFAGDQRVGIT